MQVYLQKALLALVGWVVGLSGLQAQLLPNLGSQRAGISAMNFLKIDASPRAAAMAGAQVAVTGDGFATHWNPAALTDVSTITFALSNTFWVAGINHAYLSSVFPTKRGGVWAGSATALTSGKMERRTEFQPTGTGEYFYAGYAAVGATYAKQLTDMFSYGITIKYVNETLDNFVAHAGGVDLGFLYRTDFRDLKFAVALTNFGLNSTLSGEREKSPINDKPISLSSAPMPTIFSLGVSMMPIKNEKHELTTALQLNHPNDNNENIRIGLEYGWRKLLYFRAGYKIGVADQPFPTAGVALRARVGKNPLTFDWAFDPMKYLGIVHRIGISLGLNREKRD